MTFACRFFTAEGAEGRRGRPFVGVTEESSLNVNEVSGIVVDSAMEVHSALGPGLLESAYEACLAHELRCRELHVLSQQEQPVVYKGVSLEVGYRLDLLVQNLVVVEVKAVSKLSPIHEAQLLSYLKLSGHKVGLLINFNVLHLRDGLKRLVNKL
jgi:GxxExxY protein